METAHLDNLTSIAMVTTAALLCGIYLVRLQQPAVVGYILAGVALGPTGLRFVENTQTVQSLADLGVIMLLFLIGMELSLKSFKAVYKTALATAALQIAASLVVFWVVGQFLGWGMPRVVGFAFVTALSSTAVTIKILETTDDLNTAVGRTTVSTLIAQDLAVIPMLLIVSAFGAGAEAGGNLFAVIGVKLAASVGFLAALTWYLSRHARLVLPMTEWIHEKSEVMPLAALAFCFTCSTISGALGLSPAFGAFVSGLIIGASTLRSALHRAAVPVQSLLLMAFFLSVGLLIDLDYIFAHWRNVLLVLAIVMVMKTTVNVGILRLLGEPWDRAFHSGVAMAQVGEFSFVICAAALAGGVFSADGYNLMIAVIALSLLISPLWLAIAHRLHDLALGKPGS